MGTESKTNHGDQARKERWWRHSLRNPQKLSPKGRGREVTPSTPPAATQQGCACPLMETLPGSGLSLWSETTVPKGEHAPAPLPTATKPEQRWPRWGRSGPAAPARLSRLPAKVPSAPRGCFTSPSPAPGKSSPWCRALTQEEEEEGSHQAPRQPHGKLLCLGPLPEGWWKVLMGNGDSHPAILKAAGRKLPSGGGFLCLDTARRGWGAGCNSKVTRLWEVTASTPAPRHLGKSDAQGPSCCCVHARCPALPAMALLSRSSSQANPLPRDSHFVAWSSLFPANRGGEGPDPGGDGADS